jgi:tetratricopeptide (TPR) repeat protein
MKSTHFILIVGLTAVSCSQKSESTTEATSTPIPVATSLNGEPFYEPKRTEAQQAKLDSNLQVAKRNFENDPSEENYIWYGRREGYLMHLDEAIRIFTEGLQKYPDSYRLYRHRGHRYISARNFGNARSDFEKAAELMEGKPLETEPDGQPNKLNIPLSSTQFNVWYHLALAHYLLGDFEKAEKAYLECLAVSDNDDSKVAVYDWLYMTYRRQDKKAEASRLLESVTDKMNIIENDSYYNRLKMYKGLSKPEELLSVDPSAEDYDLSMATQGYGVGNWYLYNGDEQKAKEVFGKVTAGSLFAAFGFIAAENDLAKIGGGQ